MAVITISRQFGSLGFEIAGALEESLGFNCLDKESMEKQLVGKYEIPGEKVERYDEKKPGFWDSLSLDKDRYFHFMKTVVYEFAQKGDCIVLGRGAQVLFAGVPGVLRVRVVSPPDVRVERIRKKYRHDEDRAKKMIRRSDIDRAGFHKSYFGVNWEDPGLYDLTINSDSFSVEASVRLIKEAVEAGGIMNARMENERKLEDLRLGQEALTRIVYKDKVFVEFIDVSVENGVVTLNGLVREAKNIELCEKIVRSMAGVKDVVNEISFSPPTYDY